MKFTPVGEKKSAEQIYTEKLDILGNMSVPWKNILKYLLSLAFKNLLRLSQSVCSSCQKKCHPTEDVLNKLKFELICEKSV